MENNNIQNQADGRIVHAVRNLRTNSSQKDNLIKTNLSNNTQKTDKNRNNRYDTMKSKEKEKTRTFILSQDKTTTRDATPSINNLQKTTLLTEMKKIEEEKNIGNNTSTNPKKIKLKLATSINNNEKNKINKNISRYFNNKKPKKHTKKIKNIATIFLKHKKT